MSIEKAVIEYQKAYPALDPSGAAREALAEALGEDNPEEIELGFGDLPLVKFPSGGSLYWEIGNEAPQAEIEGVVVAVGKSRAYWATPMGEGNIEPDCRSFDGRTGEGQPGGACKACPLSRFGSDPKNQRGQACKEMRRLVIVRKGSALPIIVSVPPTSLQAWKAHAVAVAAKGRRVFQVVSKLTLTEATSKDGIKYAKLAAAEVEELPYPFAEQIEEGIPAFKAILAQRVKEETPF